MKGSALNCRSKYIIIIMLGYHIKKSSPIMHLVLSFIMALSQAMNDTQSYQHWSIYQPYLLPAAALFLLALAKLSSNASLWLLAELSNCWRLCFPGAIALTGLCIGAWLASSCMAALLAEYSCARLKLASVAFAAPSRPNSWRFCAAVRLSDEASV